MLPVLAGLFLVGCGDAAANDACSELQKYERAVLDAHEEEASNKKLSEAYREMSELSEDTGGELGDALTELQPLLQQLQHLTGDNEKAAADAEQQLAQFSDAQLENIDEAADYVNKTCDLSVLL